MRGTSHRLNRFVMALAVAAVAAVTYVATAPGGVQAGPTAQQFATLKKQVGKLQRQVTSLQKEADATFAVLALCVVHKPIGVDQVGTATSGYLFGPPQAAPTAVTATASSALNLAPSTEIPPQHRFFELNTSQSACVKLAAMASTLTTARSAAAFAAGR